MAVTDSYDRTIVSKEKTPRRKDGFGLTKTTCIDRKYTYLFEYVLNAMLSLHSSDTNVYELTSTSRRVSDQKFELNSIQ